MECKLFDLKSVPATEILYLGRKSWNPVLGRGGDDVKVSKVSCSFQGISVKASYSTARKSNQSITSLGEEKFGFANGLSWIFRSNGASSSSSLKESSVLDASDDEYEGVVVNSERLPSNPNAFASILQSSLSYWKLRMMNLSIADYPNLKPYAILFQGKKGVWLRLPVERSELVPIAVKEGFEYHHAERGYVMLTYWIPEGPCMLPANASHQVGVGGFVINDKNEVLVVQEKHCAPAFFGLWKLPTGFILESEEIYTGAVREVKEETGIDTEFVEVIAFRHAHHVAFDKSDLFFICMLRPLSTQIKVDDLEVQAAKWMPLVEFVEQPLIKGDNMFRKIMEICIARLGKHYCGLSAHQVLSKFDGKPSSLYYNVVDAQDFICQGS